MTIVDRTHPASPAVLLESCDGRPDSRSFRFTDLVEIIRADSLDQVLSAFAAIEDAVARGYHAAGFVSYEAAPALNPHLSTAPAADFPLLWFGIFTERETLCSDTRESASPECQISPPELVSAGNDYLQAVDSIRQAIARGETYQVNFTTRQRFRLTGDPATLYRRICRNQRAPYSAWIDNGSHLILSASPELFFSLEGNRLTMRPMKGTAPRLPQAAADREQRQRLALDPKERAENLMIVDLIRNDLGTIAETGSVQVPSLFDVETFPTVHQMTSTVSATLSPETGITDIFRALFPCGSVTGAPKRRTMEIIRELEDQPRGVYCGAIGYISPGRDAAFSVAIRTAVIDATTGHGELGIGSGITWSSDPAGELQECLAKGAFLTRDDRDFSLIESIRYDENGYLLLERHINRLSTSAAYFGFSIDEGALRARLDDLGQKLSGAHKVRLLLDADGALDVEAEPITGAFLLPPLEDGGVQMVALATRQVDSTDPFLYHKTTRRLFYDEERRNYPDCYDILFLNDCGEVTEGSYNNLVISLRGELLTPAIDCGLLPGVLREELLEAGAIREARVTRDDLYAAERLWLINSVRGWRECKLIA